MARQPRQLAGIGAADLPDQDAVNAYVGPPREVVVAADGLRIHNGTTPGGIPLARRDEVATKASIGHTAAPDANYQALVTDVQIGFAVLSASRTVTLPDVDLYPMGQVLFIADESGQCSVDRPIIITVGAGTNDTIAGNTSEQLSNAYQGLGFRRGAANVWIIAR